MKRVNLFFIAAVAATCVFVGCNKDDSDAPDIDVLINGSRRTSIEVDADQAVQLEITWTAKGKIDKIELERSIGGTGVNVPGFPKLKDFETEGGTKSDVEHFFTTTVSCPAANQTAGLEIKYTAKVTDKNSGEAGVQSKSQEITIKFRAAAPVAGEINTHSNVTVGSLDHAGSSNSACASIDGTTYAVVGISTANQAQVDFIYFDGNAANNRDKSLAAPTNSSVGSLSNVSGWTNKNATKLGLLSSVTASQFDGATTDELITTAVTTTAVNADIVSKLAANQVIGFITASGKKGLIKVISIDQSSDAANSIKISIKVQK